MAQGKSPRNPMMDEFPRGRHHTKRSKTSLLNMGSPMRVSNKVLFLYKAQEEAPLCPLEIPAVPSVPSKPARPAMSVFSWGRGDEKPTLLSVKGSTPGASAWRYLQRPTKPRKHVTPIAAPPCSPSSLFCSRGPRENCFRAVKWGLQRLHWCCVLAS